jgi:hypothetical protein
MAREIYEYIILHACTHLPTLGILPVKIKSIKPMLFKELSDMFDKSPACKWAVNQTTVLVTCRVIPTSKGK